MQAVNANKAQLSQQSEMQQAARVAEEAQRLPTLIPEWKDSTVAQKEAKDLIDWGRKVGYTDQQLASLNTSSALHVATTRKAMLYDKLQESKASVENKVRTAPRIVKPGQAEQDGPGKALRDLRTTIQKSGGRGDSVAEWLLKAGKV